MSEQKFHISTDGGDSWKEILCAPEHTLRSAQSTHTIKCVSLDAENAVFETQDGSSITVASERWMKLEEEYDYRIIFEPQRFPPNV